MTDVNVTFESLYEILRNEKNRDELQELSPTYFRDVIVYLEQKMKLLANEQDSLFSEEEKHKNIVQIKNIKKIIRDIYERREKKIISLAMNNIRMGLDMPEESGMLEEEIAFYEDISALFLKYKGDILDKILSLKPPRVAEVTARSSTEGEMESPATHSAEVTTDLPENNSTANISNLATSAAPSHDTTVATTSSTHVAESTKEDSDYAQETQPQEASESKDSAPSSSTEEPSSHTQNEATAPDTTETPQSVLVRFLEPVPKFVGPELEVYGPYVEEDVASLPRGVVNVLLEKGRAEEIKGG